MVVHAETFLNGIQPDELADYWPLVVDLIYKPLRRMGNDLDYQPDDVLRECQQGRMQLWVVHDQQKILCAVVTEITPYPQRKVLTVMLTGAVPHTMHRWMSHIETIKAWGREHGCEALRVEGRKGWQKLLEPDVVRTQLEIRI